MSSHIEEGSNGGRDGVGLDSVGARLQKKIPPARWVRPLDELLGDEEPDEDDSTDWILRDVLPRGEPALLYGPPKSGKTWAALDMAIAIALGENWLDGAAPNTMGAPARVLVLALEDHERRLRRRLWELARGRGVTPNELRGTLSVTRARLRIPDPSDIRAFTAELKVWKPAAVIIDNVTRVLVGDPNSTRDAAAFTLAWGNICLDVGAAVQMLHHSRKSTGERDASKDDALDGARGSGDLVAAARHVMRFRPIEGLDGREVCEVAARGNLEIRTPERAIELVRDARADGRMRARLIDAGDVRSIRAEAFDGRSEAKRAVRTSDMERRHRFALSLARDRGHVSGAALAAVAAVSEPTAARDLRHLEELGLLGAAGDDGRAITDAGRIWLADRGVS